MRFLFLSILATACCVACAGPIAAGPYPHGFTAGSQMHYVHPRVARLLFGPPDPISDPLASGYVVIDSEGHCYVSPKLLAKQPRLNP